MFLIKYFIVYIKFQFNLRLRDDDIWHDKTYSEQAPNVNEGREM